MMLQNNPLVAKIRNGLTKKILSEIDKLSRDDEAAFASLWQQFGGVIKEGLYDALEHRDGIFKICRFATTHDAVVPTSLSDYIDRMKEEQDTIYYISGDKADSLRNSPQLEGFKSRGIEVLLMTDTVDEFWLQQITEFKDKKFKSITKGDIDLNKFEGNKNEGEEGKESDKNESDSETFDALTRYLQTQLSDQISFARLSKRLTESPVCLVADEGGVDMHMEKVLKLQQKYEPDRKPVLEINANHPLIEKMASMIEDKSDEALLKDSALMLMDQALIIQGETLSDPAAFAKRMANFMQKGLIG